VGEGKKKVGREGVVDGAREDNRGRDWGGRG